MLIATAKSRKSKSWRTADWTWEQFVDKVRTPRVTGETAREYRAMPKEQRDLLKDVGGFVGGALAGTARKTDSVVSRSLITLDADNAKPGVWQSVTTIHEFTMCCYATHSSTPEHPRLRWVIPTDRPMTPEEYPAVARKVASWLDIESMDPSTYEVGRLMYWASCPKDVPYEFHEQSGDLLSVDSVLAMYGAGEAWRDTELWPISSAESEVRLRSVEKAGDPSAKPGMVGLFCRTYTIYDAIEQFLPDVYLETSIPDRYTFAGGTTANGAVVYGGGDFLFSHHATDPCGGQLCNAFDLVRIHKFGHLDEDVSTLTTITNRPSYKQMCSWAKELPELKQKSIEEQLAKADLDFADMLQPAETDEDWRSKLMTLEDGTPEQCITNAVLYLTNLPEFKDRFSRNLMTDTIEIRGSLPWDSTPEEGNAVRVWDDHTFSSYYMFFEKLGYRTKAGRNGALDHALQRVADRRSYHPIREYLKNLTWDGTNRVDDVLIRWMGAEDCELNRVITRLWFIGAVDRIMRPGCKFDQILVLTGEQGAGKTMFFNKLAWKQKYYTNAVTSFSMEKTNVEKLRGKWIVDFGELDSVRKSGITELKNFVTSTQDDYRVAYARISTEHPRQCVFCGTSNEASFLRDDTGERRFWVVPVKKVVKDENSSVLEGFENEVDQLWAEAYTLWQQRLERFRKPGQETAEVNMDLYLKDRRLSEAMEARNETFKLPDTVNEEILNYLEIKRPSNWYEMDAFERQQFIQGNWTGDESTCTLEITRISIKEIRYELFLENFSDTVRRGDSSLRICSALDALPGWKKGKRHRDKAYGQHAFQYWEKVQ